MPSRAICPLESADEEGYFVSVFAFIFVFASVFVLGICSWNQLMRNGFVLRQIKRNQITYKSIKFASESKAVGHICLLNTGDLCPLSPVLLRWSTGEAKTGTNGDH